MLLKLDKDSQFLMCCERLYEYYIVVYDSNTWSAIQFMEIYVLHSFHIKWFPLGGNRLLFRQSLCYVWCYVWCLKYVCSQDVYGNIDALIKMTFISLKGISWMLIPIFMLSAMQIEILHYAWIPFYIFMYEWIRARFNASYSADHLQSLVLV